MRVCWDWDAFFGERAAFAGLGSAGTLALLPPAYRPICEQAIEQLRMAMHALGKAPDVWGLIHADLHLDNIVFAGGEARPIDFDDCGFGYWIYDIAVALWLLRGRPDWAVYRDAFLAGYARYQPVPIAQLSHLDTFIAARDVMLGLWMLAEAQRNRKAQDGLAEELGGIAQLVSALLNGT